MQPNAPGTQGYNLYAYTANNPTTWTDLSGHAISDAVNGFLYLATACRLDFWCAAPLTDGLRRVSTGEWLVQLGGFVESVLAVVACALTSSCLRLSQDIGLIVDTYGGGVDTGGGNRPPSPATCVRDAVKGLATGGVPGAIHACAAAINDGSGAPPSSSGVDAGGDPLCSAAADDAEKRVKEEGVPGTQNGGHIWKFHRPRSGVQNKSRFNSATWNDLENEIIDALGNDNGSRTSRHNQSRTGSATCEIIYTFDHVIGWDQAGNETTTLVILIGYDPDSGMLDKIYNAYPISKER